MDKICPNVDMKDKRLIAEKTVFQIKDHALCENKECFNVIYLCSFGKYCEDCGETYCKDCCTNYCEDCDETYCKDCYKTHCI